MSVRYSYYISPTFICTLQKWRANTSIFLDFIRSIITAKGATPLKEGDTRHKGDYMIIARKYCIMMKKDRQRSPFEQDNSKALHLPFESPIPLITGKRPAIKATY